MKEDYDMGTWKGGDRTERERRRRENEPAPLDWWDPKEKKKQSLVMGRDV
ncbi:uncharacterized protein G2W53_005203 [Senna tora]|uniref:Uncharacterized protein n=1 Tax=Senna tora TaxID=362788 RepID=A0A834XCU2_9FABA|nr:uncharacterized protein G2W53_005203 [Senna tora]